MPPPAWSSARDTAISGARALMPWLLASRSTAGPPTRSWSATARCRPARPPRRLGVGDRHVADLAGAAGGAAVQHAAEVDGQAEAVAHPQQGEAVGRLREPVGVLGDGGEVDVVLHPDGTARGRCAATRAGRDVTSRACARRRPAGRRPGRRHPGLRPPPSGPSGRRSPASAAAAASAVRTSPSGVRSPAECGRSTVAAPSRWPVRSTISALARCGSTSTPAAMPARPSIV